MISLINHDSQGSVAVRSLYFTQIKLLALIDMMRRGFHHRLSSSKVHASECRRCSLTAASKQVCVSILVAQIKSEMAMAQNYQPPKMDGFPTKHDHFCVSLVP